MVAPIVVAHIKVRVSIPLGTNRVLNSSGAGELVPDLIGKDYIRACSSASAQIYVYAECALKASVRSLVEEDQRDALNTKTAYHIDESARRRNPKFKALRLNRAIF